MAHAETVPPTQAGSEVHPAVMALAHAIRRDIITCLADGLTTPREIAQHLDRPLGVVAYHVRMLAGYGVIEVARTEPRRGALAHFYRFTPNAFADLGAAREMFDGAIGSVIAGTF